MPNIRKVYDGETFRRFHRDAHQKPIKNLGYVGIDKATGASMYVREYAGDIRLDFMGHKTVWTSISADDLINAFNGKSVDGLTVKKCFFGNNLDITVHRPVNGYVSELVNEHYSIPVEIIEKLDDFYIKYISDSIEIKAEGF